MSHPTNLQHIAVVGGGLGGLTTAIALRQAGFSVHVYEQAPAFKPVGAALTLYPNGLHALESIAPGIVAKITEVGTTIQQIHLKQADGTPTAQMPVTLEERFGYPMLNVRWSDLHSILVDYLPAHCINLGHRYQSLQLRDSGVTLRFTNGRRVTADLVVAADGVHSPIRQTLFKGAPAQTVGRISWRYVIPFQHDALPANEATLFLSPTRNMLVTDVGQGKFFVSGVEKRDELGLKTTPAGIKSNLRTAFQDWPEPIPALLDAVEDAEIIERPIYDCLPLESWVSGRVVLLGDAAHGMVPSLGQGGNTAFEDAYTLANCLRNHSAVEQALACYQNQRQERTQIIQARSAMVSGRSYGENSASHVAKAWEQAKMAQNEFENWLYKWPQQPKIKPVSPETEAV